MLQPFLKEYSSAFLHIKNLSCTCRWHVVEMLVKCPNVEDYWKFALFCDILSNTDTKIACQTCVGWRTMDRPIFRKKEFLKQTSKNSFGSLLQFLHKNFIWLAIHPNVTCHLHTNIDCNFTYGESQHKRWYSAQKYLGMSKNNPNTHW